jgi:hypothetical protein
MRWFTEGVVPRPTGDWRWRVGLLSNKPVLQILTRRVVKQRSWFVRRFLNAQVPDSGLEYCWRDAKLEDLSFTDLQPLMSGKRSEIALRPPAVPLP